MLLIFGAPGAGKSTQGQFLASRMSWKWLSTGQVLRDQKDAETLATIQAGHMIDDSKINQMMLNVFENSSDIDRLVIDGYPRNLNQAKYLLESSIGIKRGIRAAIIIDVSQSEIENRLKLRGRLDDKSEIISSRLEYYNQQIKPVIEYLSSHGIEIIKINGEGHVGEVHDRIMEELEKRQLI